MSRFYQSKATVWPFVRRDDWEGGIVYGIPYQIDCTFKTKAEIRKDSNGREFVTTGMYFTEDARPKRQDFIAFGTFTTANPTPDSHEILDVNQFNREWRRPNPKYEVVI